MSYIKPDPQPTYLVGEVSYTCDETKIGFPNYIRGGLPQLFKIIPFGWNIVGKLKSVCSTCNKRLFIGEENGEKFSFCKSCLSK